MKNSLRVLGFLSATVLTVGLRAQCPTGQTQVTINVSTDQYGTESTWTLTGPGGAPVYASGGPYTQAAAAGAFPQTAVTACVPDGTVLIFTFNDAYGDGICCAYGSGLFSVTNGGTTYVSNTNFTGTQEVDYFQTGPQAALDLAALTLNMPNVIAQGNTTISGTVHNFGSTAVTNFTLNYSIDGGATVSSGTINANIAVGADYTFSHPTPWNATTGSHTVDAWVSDLNGTGDGNAANDHVTAAVNVATQSVQRTVLIEEFSSSTCAPCASLNSTFDPTITSVNANQPGSHIAVVKNQMNWPSPGTDPSYNPDGVTRRTYYGVSGIPDVYLNGGSVQNSYANNATNLTNETTVPAFVTMDITAVRAGNILTVNVSVTPHATFTGTHKLLISAVESYHYTGGTTSQQDFHFAMRKMLPNGGGITLANLQPGVTQTFTQTYSFVAGTVAQGNYHLWGDISDVQVVAFVQNTSSKQVLQAGFVSQLGVGIEENALSNHLSVFPNPTNGNVNIGFDLASSTNVRFTVMNLLGEQVLTSTKSCGTGAQVHTLDLSGLAEGSYVVNILADGMVATRKVTVSH